MTAPPLPCPRCGHASVVALATCMVEVTTGVGGLVYGRPEVLVLPDDARAECNSSACSWTGTAGDVRRAA